MIRFGILGFGLHAVKRVMPGFAAAKNCRVTALSRRDIGKAQESARRFNIPLAFDSAEELCRSSEVDAVFVTTPNACHLSDVLLVSARGMHDHESGELEAAAALILEFSRGTLASVLVSYRAGYRTPIEVVGENGALRADDGLNVEHPITLELRRDGAVVERETVSNQGAYARQVDAFAAAVEGTSEFPVPGEEGWQNQEILDAAYRSLKSRRAEPVERVVGPRASALSSQPISAKFKG